MTGPTSTDLPRGEAASAGFRSQRSGLSSALVHRGPEAVTEAWLRQAADARAGETKQEGVAGAAADNAGMRDAGEHSTGSESVSYVVEEFNKYRSDPDLAMAVAAIKALTGVIKRSEASTMMGLEIELRKAAELLKVRAACHADDLHASICDVPLAKSWAKSHTRGKKRSIFHTCISMSG